MKPLRHNHPRRRANKWTISRTTPTPIRICPASNSRGFSPRDPASTSSRPTIVEPRPIAVRELCTLPLLREGAA